MKIITWNANMAFRNKAHLLMCYEPDILVIPECENPEKLKFRSGEIMPADIIWHGNNTNKGLAIISFGDYKLTLMDEHDADLRTILPITVSGAKEFTLFGVWANNPADKANQYIGQVWKALHCYEQLLNNNPVILAGDFNSNTIWDKPRRQGNHSTVVEKLLAKGIESTYHHYFGFSQGEEAHATFSLYRHKDKPYHLDYCFASADFIKDLVSVAVGSYDDWAMHSDHCPVIVEFK
ncbi:exonuclease/endonuclease/phosphatase family protein [Mucilaginibacter xinganensis]|uniref:Exonuclease n=1 Tax=Mucilaginibacter xinganensis TaxID=1234841 RepID=A0A223NTB9_9SPHI|nr:exonuclease [Mucilaginibacter xinganensis]ASU32924.1 exonuclease [Mucilaginibacter xinganensis]